MRSYFYAPICAMYFAAALPAHASAVPQFAEAGDWVDVADLDEVLETAAGSEAILVILDQQTQLEPGVVSSYRDVAIRIDSAKTMSSMSGLLSPTWHPDQGDLIVHRYEIVRGSDVIDLTANDDVFQVIRREKNLERQMINGMLTAISQVEDVQLNDIVRMSFTVTKRNEALGKRVQSSGGFITEDVNVDFIRQTARWPEGMDVQWRASKDEIVPQKTSDGEWTELSFDYRSKQLDVEIPKNAPVRFKDSNYFEIGSFASWEDVSRVNAKLYPKKDGIVAGGELDRKIRAIAEQTSDKEERMALALRMVQDDIRYLFNGLGFGNYTPQSPEETWQLRYGDCKAKTYLLLAALRRLGIKSVPTLVSTTQRDAVAERMPSFQAFNHIIVKAELDGKIYWLDGTQNGTRLADMGDSPRHRYGLPSTLQGSGLEEIPIRRPGRPYQQFKVTYDLTAGTDLPAPFVLEGMLRDSDAEKLKNAATQLSAERAKEVREEIALEYVLDGLVTETAFTYDDELEAGYLTAKGLAYLEWETQWDRRKHTLWSPTGSFKVQESRDEEELRDLPVVLAFPRHFKYDVVYQLPERYQSIEMRGQSRIDEDVAGYRVDRSVRKIGNQIVSEEQYHTGRWEMPASEFERERQKLALIQRNKVEVVLPEDTPEPWEEVAAYKASPAIEVHREAFDKHVANAKPDDDSALTNRAYFFQTIGEYELAIADVQAALAIDTDPENYKWLGDLQLGLDIDAAKASYGKAIEIRPAYFAALLELIRIHLGFEDFNEANAVLENARSNGLRDASVDSLQIEILQAEGQFDAALKVMDALIDEDPNNANYLADRCLLRVLEKTQLDLALEDCTNSIELAERRPYYHFLRGLLYHRSEQYDAAIKDLDKAIRAGGRYAYVYKLRSASHSALGDADMAASDLQAAKFYYKYSGWYWDKFFDL